jgi:hypothetical protein
MHRFIGFVVALAAVVAITATPALGDGVSTTFPVSGSFTEPCTGELVTYSGRIHAVDVRVEAGGTGINELHLELSDLHGTTASGAVYNFHEWSVVRFNRHIEGQGSPFGSVIFSIEERAVGVTAGPAADRFALLIVVDLVYSNGEFHVLRSDVAVEECR